ncbi:putative disease resistance protein RGA4 [Carex rostrata]
MASVILSSIISVVSKLTGSSSSSSTTADELQGDLRHLKRTLLRIQAVIADAEEREIRDESVKLWLQELRDVAVQADDVLDEYHYELLRQQAIQEIVTRKSDISIGSPVMSADSSSLESIEKKIKAIRRMFDEIERERDALHLRECDGERRHNASWKPVPTSSFLSDSKIYGREEDEKEIVKFLLGDDLGDKKEIVKTLRDGKPDFRSISVLPILGIGGLGKTTLAQLAYNNESVRKFFDFRVWICVSDNFDVVRITKQMVESCTDHPCDATELDELQKILARLLKKKKLLVVLDDVYNESPILWEFLKAPFSHGHLTKVLATTRSELVGSIMQTTSPHRLNHLNVSHCLEIFGQFATRPLYWRQPFHQSNNNRFETIARQIAVKCKGLPLVAKTLGSLLHNEIDEDRWREVAESELWELEDQGNDILPVLRLSYHRMPAYLKHCFTYLCLFPKSYVFQRDYVVKLWIAQGYVVTKGKRTLEDIACAYFDELIQRSMLQPSQFSKTKNEGFLMHDLIHDLAVHISGNRCLPVVDNKTVNIGTDLLHASFVPSRDQVILDFYALRKARHLRTLLVPMSRQMQGSVYDVQDSMIYKEQLGIYNSTATKSPIALTYIHNSGNEALKDYAEIRGKCNLTTNLQLDNNGGYDISDSMIQNFQCYNSSGYEIPDSMIDMFQQLRALDLSYTGLQKVPNRIGELKHLRYLAFRETNITGLPESICKLYNLQVLDLDRCENLRKLPRGMKNLTELKHLKIPILEDSHFCMPKGMGNLTNLQTLSAFYIGGDVYHCGIHELTGLVNLKGDLKIYGLNRVLEQTFPDLSRLRLVKKLILYWDVGSSDKCNYGGIEEGQNLYTDAASVLGGLKPPINIEELVVDAFDGSQLSSWMGNCYFFNLSSISLDFCNSRCTDLPPLGRLPTLKHLSVQGMDALKIIGPEFCGCTSTVTRCFPRLETLEFSDMSSWVEWYTLHNDNFPRLTELTISCCILLLKLPFSLSSSICTLELQDCDSLSSIPMLPSLTSLILRGRCPFYLWSRSLCLPELNHLQISYFRWRTLEFFPNLPMLKTVKLEHCMNIDEVIGLKHLKSLKVLKLHACPNLKVAQEDVQHSNCCVFYEF